MFLSESGEEVLEGEKITLHCSFYTVCSKIVFK